MPLYGSSVEYGLHCLLYLVDPPAEGPPSARDLAEFQGISPSYVAKLFTQLQKAGIVESAEGIRGGFRLARPASQITALDVVRALEGEKPLFECKEIRRHCILYDDEPPDWATHGVCGIHRLMIEAEERMRDVLAGRTLAEIANGVAAKIPARHERKKRDWFDARARRRQAARGPKPDGEERRT